MDEQHKTEVGDDERVNSWISHIHPDGASSCKVAWYPKDWDWSLLLPIPALGPRRRSRYRIYSIPSLPVPLASMHGNLTRVWFKRHLCLGGFHSGSTGWFFKPGADFSFKWIGVLLVSLGFIENCATRKDKKRWNPQSASWNNLFKTVFASLEPHPLKLHYRTADDNIFYTCTIDFYKSK